MYSYEWQWTPGLHVRAFRATMKHGLGLQRHTWLIFPIFLLLVSLPGLVGLLDGDLSYLYSAGPWLVLLLLWPIFIHYVVPWLTARWIAKNDPSTKGPISHLISEQGFGIRSKVASVDLVWDHLKQVVETSEFLLFYYNPNAAYATPLASIPAEDLPGLRVLLRRHVGLRAKLKKTA